MGLTLLEEDPRKAFSGLKDYIRRPTNEIYYAVFESNTRSYINKKVS